MRKLIAIFFITVMAFPALPAVAVDDPILFYQYQTRLRQRRERALVLRREYRRSVQPYNPFRTFQVNVSPYQWQFLQQPPLPVYVAPRRAIINPYRSRWQVVDIVVDQPYVSRSPETQ